MNRFRSKKRQNESAGLTRRPSLEVDVPPLPTISAKPKTFRRNKKGEPPPKPEEPEVDLKAALPSSDDFRTSLLMPNLSARFSMLREQDDPRSKLGKANDDSVLFPKRASRLDLFNRQGLSDITEVDSVRGSLRPPFAYKSESYSTDGNGAHNEASRNGSIMSRAKPGEGNTLFGGRQKIYKIPIDGTGSARSSSVNEDSGTGTPRGMGGKALYESDIATSAFQRLREQEKAKFERESIDRPSTRSSKEDERSVTPPVGQYSRKRETSSSTNSGPSYPRTSTAATSLASQKSVYGAPNATNGSSSSVTCPIPSTHPSPTLDRPGHPGTKGKRLYGHGLDQHMYEQQSSAMHRLESLHRQRAVSPPVPHNLQQSRSATNLQDRYQRGGPFYASNSYRAGSPPPTNSPSRMAEFDLGLSEENPISGTEKNDSGYGRSPPLSPLVSPLADQTFISALEPNDVGKATASGAFNKPKKQYNEQQYLQRQMQLQQGRQTPPPARPFSPIAPSIDEQVTGRARNGSLASTRSVTGSLRRPQEQQELQTYDYPLNTVHEALSPRQRKPSEISQTDANTSFLNGFSGSELGSQSENEADPDSPLPSPQYQNLTAPAHPPKIQETLSADHPNYHQPQRLPTAVSEEPVSDTLSQRTITHSHNSSISKVKNGLLDVDSPTLGPTNGLNGLVRTHLRNESDQSSIYPEQSPSLLAKFPGESYNSSNQPHTFYSHDALSDDEQGREPYLPPKPDHPEDMPPPLAVTARAFLEQATALKHQESLKAKQILGNDKAQRILGREAPRSSQESNNVPSWQDQLRAHHARGGSTETEKEREAFASELAERRRMVQDNLKTFVEAESRSASPAPSARNRDDSSGNPKSGYPFGMLRSKNSGTSLAGKNEQPSKAMKMLGISPGSNPPGHASHLPVRNTFPEESEQRSRYMNDGQRAQLHPRRQTKTADQKPSPPLSKSKGNRASSEILEKTPEIRESGQRETDVHTATGNVPQMINSSSNIARGPPREVEESSPVSNTQQGPTGSLQFAVSGRNRSNSRTNAPGYFGNRGATRAPTGTPINVGTSQRQSPIVSAYSSHSAPVTSESLPNSSNFTAPVMITSPPSAHSYNRRPTYRKGSINKHDISEPHFLSATSSVSTVDLPPGTSLRNGMDSPPPPVPPLNPRRKRTQTLLQALGRLEKTESAPAPAPAPIPSYEDPYEERSTFSADEGDSKPKSFRREKLRKSSSEGGNLNAKARHQAMIGPSPAMPQGPPDMSAPPSPSKRQFSHETSPPSNPSVQLERDGQLRSGGSANASPVVRQYPEFSAASRPTMQHPHPVSAAMF